MKKQLLALSLLALTGTQSFAQTAKQKKSFPKNTGVLSKSQVAPPSNMYSFSTFTAPYQPITGTSLTNGTKWDDPNHVVPLGFNFSFYNASGNSFYLWGASAFSFNDFDSEMIVTEGGAMWEDMCDRSYDPTVDNEGDAGGSSDISYTTTGTPGSRICKIQLDNVGFYGENDALGTSSSFVNLQMWFYEGTNDIEFRYGNISTPNKAESFANGAAGFMAGLVDSLDYNTFAFGGSNFLNGVHSSPAMVALAGNFTEVISGDIDNGRVYKFTRMVPTDVRKIQGAKNISLYPNPAKNLLHVKGNISSGAIVTVFDLTGKEVLQQNCNEPVSVSSLDKGLYLVKVTENGKEMFTGKLVITE